MIAAPRTNSTHLIVRGKRVVTPTGVRAAAVLIRDGKIVGVAAPNKVPRTWPAGSAVYDAGDGVVMPGLVDTHVHINEPGRTQWEGFHSATRAAAAGGTTTLVDMPLNSIPATTTRSGLLAKRNAARGKCWVDVGFWGGVVPGNAGELQRLHRAGVLGFKCFLVPSGVDEFRSVAEPDLRAALPILAKLKSVLLAHAELPGPIERAAKSLTKADPTRHQTWLRSRPPAAELEAIELLIRLSQGLRARVHVVHLACAEAVPLLRRARAKGLPITVETCPHYLFFDSAGASSTLFKCAPPIRSAQNQRGLWTALRSGVIDFVVSDHSPCPPEMKSLDSGDFFRAWGGIASLELRLPILWTAAQRRGYGLADLSRWLSAAPARLAGLAARKGFLAPGRDADIVVWNPDAKFTVDPALLHQRHKITPYARRTLSGVVEATFLRGVKVFDRGQFAAKPQGQLLERTPQRAPGRAPRRERRESHPSASSTSK